MWDVENYCTMWMNRYGLILWFGRKGDDIIGSVGLRIGEATLNAGSKVKILICLVGFRGDAAVFACAVVGCYKVRAFIWAGSTSLDIFWQDTSVIWCLLWLYFNKIALLCKWGTPVALGQPGCLSIIWDQYSQVRDTEWRRSGFANGGLYRDCCRRWFVTAQLSFVLRNAERGDATEHMA